MPQIPLTLTAYESRSRPFSTQRIVNLYVVSAQAQAKTQVLHQKRPSLVLSVGLEAKAPCRGAFTWSGTAHLVLGSQLHRVTSAIQMSAQLGGVEGQSPVSITGNANHMVIASKALNGTFHRYLWDGSTFTDVTNNSNLDTGNTVAILNGFVFSDMGDQVTNRGRFQWSDANDATTYQSANFANAESAEDSLLAVAVANQTLFLFGERTIELWAPTAGTPPVARIPNIINEVGLVAVHSIARFSDNLFFLGRTEVGGVGVYQIGADGFARVISNDGLHAFFEQGDDFFRFDGQISGIERIDLSDAEGWCYAQDGQSFYVLTLPTQDRTFVYSMGSGLWSEWMSGTGDEDERGRWRAAWHCYAYDRHFVGDYQFAMTYDLGFERGADRIYRIIDTPTGLADEVIDDPISCILTTPPLGIGERRNFMNNLWLDMDTGLAENMRVSLQISDDGGNTFSQERIRNGGPIGNYNGRILYRQMPSFRTSRMLKFKITDNCPVRIHGAYTEGGGGIG